MKNKKINWLAVLLIASVVGMIAFILLNSFLDFSASHKLSGTIMQWLFKNANETNGIVEDFWLRKTAHLVEYALLGVSVGSVLIFFIRRYKKRFIGFSLFGMLFIAVLDEFIQSFSDRTSSATDVLLDFGGAAIGLALVFVFEWIIKTKNGRTK